MEVDCTSGKHTEMSLKGKASISEHFERFNAMLDEIRHPCFINPVPQEMFTDIPFNDHKEAFEFDTVSARRFFEQNLFAYRSILGLVSSFRGKKIMPALFWGTLDMTRILYSGTECPYPDKGTIEEVAFDEKLIEFGYWTGDEAENEPMFFVLSYPFLEGSIPDDAVSPKEAFYSVEKAEYFLRLEDAFSYEDAQRVVEQFFKDSFALIAKNQKWENLDWLTKPLLIS